MKKQELHDDIIELNQREIKVLREVIKHGTSPDKVSVESLIEITKLRPEQVMATLLILEVRRLVRQFPGKRYEFYPTGSGYTYEAILKAAKGGS